MTKTEKAAKDLCAKVRTFTLSEGEGIVISPKGRLWNQEVVKAITAAFHTSFPNVPVFIFDHEINITKIDAKTIHSLSVPRPSESGNSESDTISV